MTLKHPPIPARFHSLDVIRGVAALVVVVWHWQHFLLGGTGELAFRQTDQPFYAQLSMFYHWGWLAVDFFFSLSGFVFFWLYGEAVATRGVDGWRFFVARFSRLYPLHLVTFTFVLLAQLWFHAREGGYFIYQFNDGFHAVLNLLMASGWGLEKGPSYNGPFWSVSVEVMLYLMFFLLCRWKMSHPLVLVLLAIVGLGVLEILPAIGRGMISFFAGGVAFAFYSAIRRSPRGAHAALGVVMLAALCWVLVLFDFSSGRLSNAVAAFAHSHAPARLQANLPELLGRIKLQGIAALLFPLTIVALALAETWRGTLGRRVSFIGHLSYSSYLLHFPLQLSFVSLVSVLGVDRGFFYSRASFLLFVGVLLPLCFASYYWLELPAQRYLRRRLFRQSHVSAAAQKV